MFPNESNYPLNTLCRVRTGGTALYYAVAEDFGSLKRSIQFAQDNNLSSFVLGRGCNVVLGDSDFQGVVIKLGSQFNFINFDKEEGYVSVGGGTSLMKLGFCLANLGYKEYTYMGVIPGTIGGAINMNAGTTNDGEIRDHFLRAVLLNPNTLEISIFHKEDMMFDYRHSVLSQSRLILLEAFFKLPQNAKVDKSAAMNRLRRSLANRRTKQPKNPRTFGSVFKNPGGGKPAGWYLDAVGMKGLRKGDAMVTNEHANWIVNLGTARSENIKSLIAVGKHRVFDEFGVNLEREVVYLPEDMKDWN